MSAIAQKMSEGQNMECVKTINRCVPLEGHCPVWELASKFRRWLPAKFLSCLE